MQLRFLLGACPRSVQMPRRRVGGEVGGPKSSLQLKLHRVLALFDILACVGTRSGVLFPKAAGAADDLSPILKPDSSPKSHHSLAPIILT